jgi:hypothetical protein
MTRVKLFDTPLQVSKVVAIAAGSVEFKKRWISEWNSSPRGLQLSLLGDTTPCLAIPRMYDDLAGPDAAWSSRCAQGTSGSMHTSIASTLPPPPTARSAPYPKPSRTTSFLAKRNPYTIV